MHLVEEMFIQIGRKRFHVPTFKDASDLYCAARDRSGLGVSKFPSTDIVTANGRIVARISYNGRVWPPGEWAPGQTPLYCTRQS